MADDRTPAQRRHDGLLEAAQRLLRSGTLPDSGGVPATIVLTLTDQQLPTRTGTAGDRVRHPDRDAGRAAAGRPGRHLHHPARHPRRHPGLRLHPPPGLSPAQRRALTARDKGCTFPGCTRPASWCQVDHVIPWYLGGPTNIDNLQLLCGWHHREYAKRGWTVHIRHGVVEWTPPAWLDPTQTPRHNTAHHLPDISFDTG